MAKLFVGNLPMDVRRSELEKIFGSFGRIVDISIKNPPRPPAFAFVEFEDARDAEDACREKNNTQLDGNILRVEISRGRGRERVARPRNNRSEFRVRVTNLPEAISWQDLKDIMRDFGEVLFTEVDRRGGGVAEFSNRSDMTHCIEKLDDTNIQGNYVRVSRESPPRGGGRSRSPPRRPRYGGRGGYGGGRGGYRGRGGHGGRGRSRSRSPPRHNSRGGGPRRSRSPPRAQRERSPPRRASRSPEPRRDERDGSRDGRGAPRNRSVDRRERSPDRRERSPDRRQSDGAGDRSPDRRDARRDAGRSPEPRDREAPAASENGAARE